MTIKEEVTIDPADIRKKIIELENEMVAIFQSAQGQINAKQDIVKFLKELLGEETEDPPPPGDNGPTPT